MEEWIKKDSALEICDRWRRRAKEVHDRDGFYIANIIHEQTEELIDARPQGEWIDKGDYAECSNCGADSGTQCDGVEPVPRKTKFCPNCGARMKELINE